MQGSRPYVLTIAGFDPCAGAGLAADLKTFEQLGVYGLAVCSALTLQTEDKFISIEWRPVTQLLEEITVLMRRYNVRAVKTGIINGAKAYDEIIQHVKTLQPDVPVVVDPVRVSGTGFMIDDDLRLSTGTLKLVTIVTPNADEEAHLRKYNGGLFKHSAVLRKGGHRDDQVGVDTLIVEGAETSFLPGTEPVYPKHGTGCVLSAAIAGYLALGEDLETSCRRAKKYVEKFMSSNNTLLGYHAT